ncbi:hypothetical protein GAY33_11980 [Azospirillum brasilense]|uniref:hypothetical protein n=1 Tax=Azospirillum argentinense TaxID=2970906 RepID=UPI00190B637B|nr:hypothetical protein [Azospirillum argentinense]MBK3799943.1 hypothetical protein [Azospirillum argentinense]
MTNLVREIQEGHCDLVQHLHDAICDACDEFAGGDADKRKILQDRLIYIIGTALQTECRLPLAYKADKLPQWAVEALGYKGP